MGMHSKALKKSTSGRRLRRRLTITVSWLPHHDHRGGLVTQPEESNDCTLFASRHPRTRSRGCGARLVPPIAAVKQSGASYTPTSQSTGPGLRRNLLRFSRRANSKRRYFALSRTNSLLAKHKANL